MCWDVVIKYKRIVNDVNHSVLQDSQVYTINNS